MTLYWGELTFAGMSRARSGMWRSPITSTRRDVMIAGNVGGVSKSGGRSKVNEKLAEVAIHSDTMHTGSGPSMLSCGGLWRKWLSLE